MRCPDCGDGRLVRKFYGGRLYYGCSNHEATGCRGKVGAHQDSGEPLGTPADAKTRKMRARAHEAFDPLWMSGHVKRVEAYRLLRDWLGVSKRAAHIGKLDAAQCRALIAKVKAYRVEQGLALPPVEVLREQHLIRQTQKRRGLLPSPAKKARQKVMRRWRQDTDREDA
jgi:ssDNA-binding Zn-finger/Zn-ribbon topoisomerase 1